MLKMTFQAWSKHNDLRLGAALAYYTVFSIAPLFVIALAIAGLCFGPEAARRELFGQINGLIGPESGEAMQAMVASANKPQTGILATIIAVITLLLGATGVFVELQDALNAIWEVRVKPGVGIKHFIRVRLLSFAMVFTIGFLLLVSLVVSAALAALGKYLEGVLPTSEVLLQIVNFALSLGLITVLYALIFKFLPDVHVSWRDVWGGALFSALLFDLGKFVLGAYLGRGWAASVYGAASSVLIILLWVYYSSQTLFLGAELTRIKAIRAHRKIKPVHGAEFAT